MKRFIEFVPESNKKLRRHISWSTDLPEVFVIPSLPQFATEESNQVETESERKARYKKYDTVLPVQLKDSNLFNLPIQESKSKELLNDSVSDRSVNDSKEVYYYQVKDKTQIYKESIKKQLEQQWSSFSQKYDVQKLSTIEDKGHFFCDICDMDIFNSIRYECESCPNMFCICSHCIDHVAHPHALLPNLRPFHVTETHN
ncbi:hypothetical protein WA158_003157 [Blastocystis sp. Blastoise]